MKCVFAAVCVAGVAQSVLAWDAVGHRAIGWLALDALPPDAPAFLREPGVRHAVAWNAAEPDRWRGQKNAFIMNSTYMDHFIDLEDLSDFGMTIDTVPMMRYRFVRDVAIARSKNPAGPDGTSKPYNEKQDPTGQNEFPGFTPHAICELHARLTSHFKTYRMLQKLNDPGRAPQLEMTKANIMSTMGILAHYTGDVAQPLHTTKHHHGWIGPNPNNYTTDGKIHAYIDGTVIFQHGLNYNTLKPTQTYTISIDKTDPASVWQAVIAYTKRSHGKVEETYKLFKDKAFEREEGKRFIVERLNDAGAMLGAIYASAWNASVPTQQDLDDLVRYDGFRPDQVPQQDREPAEKPAEKPSDKPATP